MSFDILDQLQAVATPFDNAFDPEVQDGGTRLESFPIWTQCGLRLDLIARVDRWQPLDLRAVIDDVEAVWNGYDAIAWDSAV